MVDVRTVDGDRLVKSFVVPTTVMPHTALSRDGKLFVAPSEDKLVVIDVDSGRTLFEPPCRKSSQGRVFTLSSDASLLACETEAAVVVYNVRTKKVVKKVPHWGALAIAISADNKILAISGRNILIVDL